MKTQVTKKQVKNSFLNIFSIGYCGAQHLTYYKRPFAYSSGVYGWACDYYDVDGVCLSTGYAPIGEDVNYKLLRKYEERAEKIINNYELKYEVREKRVNKLLSEFINKSKN